MKFIDLGLEPDLLDGILALGFEETTEIQAEAIPSAMDGRDLIACAQTGTGKTAAFLIPTIHRLMQQDSSNSRVLIIVPTRELALQIDQNVDALSYFTGISSVPIFGGNNKENWDRQTFGIRNGADILIATPGRLLMHMSLGYLKFDHIETVILDEADKMLDMGFANDILKIVSQTPSQRQTLMFSATMPKKIRKLAIEILNDPEEISLNLAKPAEGVTQKAYMLFDEQKIPMLEHIMATAEVESMIIFASSKVMVDRINRTLKRLGHPVKAIHSDKSQEERQETLRAFKNRQFRILVGTDVLARGIDIDNLSHVLNFDVPLDAEDYVHRVGRTARASNTGEAITFITPKDQFRMVNIEELIEMEVPKPDAPEELGERPVYNPRRRRSGGRNNRSGRGRNHRKAGHSNRRRNNKRSGNQQNRSTSREQKPNAASAENKSSEGRKRRRNRRRPKRTDASPRSEDS